MELENLFSEIINKPLFLKLKQVVENYEGFHSQEDVYSHSLKTAKIAKENISGNFITDANAKYKFNEFTDRKIGGMKKSDLMIIAALLHDCGKLLHFKEGGEVYPIIKQRPNYPKQTTCPGHEHYGGDLVVKEILKEINISDQAKFFISSIVRLHDSLNNFSYYTEKKEWQMEDIISDIKARSEGFYIECMYNAYCDCYTAPPFNLARTMIEKIFSVPSLYITREYFIA